MVLDTNALKVSLVKSFANAGAFSARLIDASANSVPHNQGIKNGAISVANQATLPVGLFISHQVCFIISCLACSASCVIAGLVISLTQDCHSSLFIQSHAPITKLSTFLPISTACVPIEAIVSLLLCITSQGI